MHVAAYNFVKRSVEKLPSRRLVVEYGGRWINGTVKPIFEGFDKYISIDLVGGPGVDYVSDATIFKPDFLADTVVCCEVLEHSCKWPFIVRQASRILSEHGILILTCATDPRAPHSAVDGGVVRAGEFYGNVPAMELAAILDTSFAQYELEVDSAAGDLYVLAYKKDQ